MGGGSRGFGSPDRPQPPSGDAARRSLRWGSRAFGGVLLLGAAGACCGAVPLALVIAAAGAAGLAAGLGAAAFAVASAAGVALVAITRRRTRAAGARCAPSQPTRRAETWLPENRTRSGTSNHGPGR